MSRTIVHLEVGDRKFNPTAKNLEQIIQEFQQATPSYGIPVKINMIEVSPDHQRFVVVAGAADWSPTVEELEALVALFNQAALDNTGGVVATRSGVTISVVPKRLLAST